MTDNILAVLESETEKYLQRVDFKLMKIFEDMQAIDKEEQHRLVHFERQKLSAINDSDLRTEIKWRGKTKTKKSVDPVQEIRQIRDAHAAQFNYDADLIYQDWLKLQEEGESERRRSKVADQSNTYKNKKKEL